MQGRVDVEAGIAFPGGEEMPLAPVQESAGHHHRRVVDVMSGGEFLLDIGQRQRCCMGAPVDGLEQSFLPVQALDLPGAETEENGEQDKAGPKQQCVARPRAAGSRTGRVAHWPLSSLPSAALWGRYPGGLPVTKGESLFPRKSV